MSENQTVALSLDRASLYELVWKEPMRVLAKRFSISDVGLAKTCKRLKIPFPRLGYWQKVRHGKKVNRPPLPPIDEAEPQKIVLVPRQEKRKPEVEPEFAAKVEAAIELEEREENRIVAQESLDSPHLLVTRTLANFKGQKPDDKGCVYAGRDGGFPAYVGPDMVPRVLRILDALLKAIEKRGHQILLEKPQKDPNGYPLPVVPKILVFGETLGIGFREALKKLEKEFTPEEKARRKQYPGLYSRTEYVLRPKGRLELHIHGERIPSQTWRDTERTRIEDRLSEVMAGLLEASREVRAAEIQHKRWEEARREEEKRRWEEADRKREEEKKIRELEAMVAAWKKSQEVKAFLKAAREMVIARDGGIDAGGKIDQWLQWGEGWAKSFDPLRLE